jgi:hypothetical protein
MTPPGPPLLRGEYQKVPPNKRGSRGGCFFKIGWLVVPEGYKVSLAGLFHHSCLPNVKQFLQLVGEVLKVELDNDISTIKGAQQFFRKL